MIGQTTLKYVITQSEHDVPTTTEIIITKDYAIETNDEMLELMRSIWVTAGFSLSFWDKMVEGECTCKGECE